MEAKRMRFLLKKLLVFSLFCVGGAGVYAQTTFGTTTDLGFETWFNPETMEAQSAGTKTHSYIRFNGTAFNKVSLFMELEAGANQALYNKNDELEWNEGFQQFFTDGLTNPLYYFMGQPSIGHVKLSIQDPYVSTELGYKYVKLPRHENALWMTVDDSWDAGYNSTGGFALFKLGSKLQKIGDIRLNAFIAPNRSADRAGTQYGFIGDVSAQYKTHTLDVQYNGGYGSSFDTIFEEIYEADYILGYSGKVGAVGIKANGLVNLWGAKREEFTIPATDITPEIIVPYRKPYSPASSDVGNVDSEAELMENMAGAVQVAYSFSRQVQAFAGYRFRGSQANLMYVKHADGDEHIKDQLGNRNTQQGYVDVTVKPISALSIHGQAGAEFAFIKDGLWKPYPGWDNVRLYVNPSVDYNLTSLTRVTSKVSLYAELNFRTAEEDWVKRGTWESNFYAPKIGFKMEIGALNDVFRGAELICGFDNQDENYFRHSYIGIVKLPQSFNVELGAIVRTANQNVEESKNPFGFFFGANKKLSNIGRPSAYAQFLWKANPYKSFTDGQQYLDLDGYLLYGLDNNQDSAALRCGLRWEF
jgi:hypothetical protein